MPSIYTDYIVYILKNNIFTNTIDLELGLGGIVVTMQDHYRNSTGVPISRSILVCLHILSFSRLS